MLLITDDWTATLRQCIAQADELFISSAYITSYGTKLLIEAKKDVPKSVIFNSSADNFIAKASDIDAINQMLDAGVKLWGNPRLHAKVYVFGNRGCIVGSANMTRGGFEGNLEAGIFTDEVNFQQKIMAYLEALSSNKSSYPITESYVAYIKERIANTEDIANLIVANPFQKASANQPKEEKINEFSGWTAIVADMILDVGKTDFELADLYNYTDKLAKVYPDNNNKKAKIRQQLQILREKGYLQFTDNAGHYKLLRSLE